VLYATEPKPMSDMVLDKYKYPSPYLKPFPNVTHKYTPYQGAPVSPVTISPRLNALMSPIMPTIRILLDGSLHTSVATNNIVAKIRNVVIKIIPSVNLARSGFDSKLLINKYDKNVRGIKTLRAACSCSGVPTHPILFCAAFNE
jgi:hypothetical protein